jgi:hypothetical protein
MALLAVFAGEIAKRRQKIIFAVGVRGEPSFFICVLNPIKYTDPDGRADFNPSNQFGQVLAKFGGNPLDRFFGKLLSILGRNNDVAKEVNQQAAQAIDNAVADIHGDVFITIELDAVAGGGFEASASVVFDLDHPLESGINVSAGIAGGANVGIGVGIGYTAGDIEGQTPLAFDGNFGFLPVSGAVFTDDKGVSGGSLSIGPGTGLSVSSQTSATLSPQTIINFMQKPVEGN